MLLILGKQTISGNMLQTTHLELGQYVFLPGLDKCYHQFIKMVQVVYRPSYELAGSTSQEQKLNCLPEKCLPISHT